MRFKRKQIVFKAKSYRQFIAFVLFLCIILPAPAAEIPGDIAEPYGQVDMADLVKLSEWWMISVCNLLDHCFGADITGPEGVPDGTVNLNDFAILAAHWMEGVQ